MYTRFSAEQELRTSATTSPRKEICLIDFILVLNLLESIWNGDGVWGRTDAEVVVDFFDQLKSRSQGYASLDYELAGYRASDLVRVDILLNALPADAFSTIVHRDKAYDYGNRMCAKLRELIPRQMFDVPIQAAIGGRIIARETVKAKRKDVLAKCYGGDISRKRKLLEKQKEGKKKMKSIGRVEVPGDVFISALKLDG